MSSYSNFNKTILVVDDDERNIYALSAILRAKGYDVLSASDGKAGINLLVSTKVNLVLMDLSLIHI